MATSNGGIPVQLNNLGYRGSDVAAAPPPGGVRIATFGGSDVFGATLGDDETWPLRLDRGLKERGFAVEVINAGVPGANITGVLQEVINLTNYMPLDIAVLMSAYNNHPLLPIERSYTMARRADAYLYNLSLFYVMFKEKLARAASQPLDYGLYHQQLRVRKADVDWLIENYRRVVDHIDTVCREKNVTLVVASQPEVFFDAALNAQSSQTEAVIDALTERIASGDAVYLAELEFYLQGRLNLEIRRAAENHQRVFFDGESVLLPDNVANFSDQIHPSTIGAARLAASLTEALTPVISARLAAATR